MLQPLNTTLLTGGTSRRSSGGAWQRFLTRRASGRGARATRGGRNSPWPATGRSAHARARAWTPPPPRAARHFNYIGDLTMCLGWAISCTGPGHIFPWVPLSYCVPLPACARMCGRALTGAVRPVRLDRILETAASCWGREDSARSADACGRVVREVLDRVQGKQTPQEAEQGHRRRRAFPAERDGGRPDEGRVSKSLAL